MDQENPFHDRTSLAPRPWTDNAHALVSPLVDNVRSQISEEGVLPPLSDHVAAQLTGMGTVPDQIRKLERQLKAARNTTSARDRKIQQMREENQEMEGKIHQCVNQRPVVWSLRTSNTVIL